MKTLRVTLRPLAHFGTPLVGDTLFGHLCWAVRERHGESHLEKALQGYTAGRPFLVVSDAFPNGFLPRPTAPQARLGGAFDPKERKKLRERRWLSISDAHLPLSEWPGRAKQCNVAETSVLTQNTINRITGTTGLDQFAPRQIDRLAYKPGTTLDVYAVFDEEVIDAQTVQQLFSDVGDVGYGRDASTGLGKFAVEHVDEHWPGSGRARHFMTLAPCAPQVDALEARRCYYQPLTRFGRHGNMGVRLGAPFKKPLLMMKTAALLTAREPSAWVFHGRGLGGRDQPLSKVIPDTVHQGYAPLVALNAELAP